MFCANKHEQKTYLLALLYLDRLQLNFVLVSCTKCFSGKKVGE